jgi:hypothetical protein
LIRRFAGIISKEQSDLELAVHASRGQGFANLLFHIYDNGIKLIIVVVVARVSHDHS